MYYPSISETPNEGAPARGSPTLCCLMVVGGGSSPQLGVRLRLRTEGHWSLFNFTPNKQPHLPDELAITLKKR